MCNPGRTGTQEPLNADVLIRMDTASHAVVGVLGIKHHAHEGSLTYLCLEPAKPDLEPFPRTLNLKHQLSETGTFNGKPQTSIPRTMPEQSRPQHWDPTRVH